MRSLIKSLMFFLLNCLCMAGNAKVEQYKIWYIPLDRSYYTPVTSESIEGQANRKLTKASPKFDHLFSEAEKKVEFKGFNSGNDFRIKLMRKRDSSVLYINRDKSVSVDGIIVNIPSNVVQEAIDVVEKKKK